MDLFLYFYMLYPLGYTRVTRPAEGGGGALCVGKFANSTEARMVGCTGRTDRHPRRSKWVVIIAASELIYEQRSRGRKRI